MKTKNLTIIGVIAGVLMHTAYTEFCTVKGLVSSWLNSVPEGTVTTIWTSIGDGCPIAVHLAQDPDGIRTIHFEGKTVQWKPDQSAEDTTKIIKSIVKKHIE